jgi:hypothetical protein
MIGGKSMSDLIERQAAIDAFMTATSDVDKAEWCKWVLEQLPSVAKDTNVPCKDLISRQAVIDIVNGYETRLNGYIGTNNDSEVYAYARGLLLSIQRNIDALPSAQPEIILCKECKHYKAYEYTGRLACHYVIGGTVVRNPDDFCSRAERRTE